MARFDSGATLAPKRRMSEIVPNRDGGFGYKQDDKVALASLVLTSFVQDQYARSASEGLSELAALAQKVDPRFAAKTAIYARNEFGMRSITHALAGELAHNVKGQPWTKDFYDKVVRRPDDITEILAYYLGTYGKPVPNSLKKGLGRAFGKFDAYQLAKYRGEGRNLSLVDAVNIVHPAPTEKNADALHALVDGTLRSRDTWEQRLSQAGKADDKSGAKEKAWMDLVAERKIGYFALLRNLRNIEEQAPDLLDAACEMLVDPKLIKNSLVLPFRFMTAREQVSTSKAVEAISDAIDISVANVPSLPGKTLIAVDHSGSMGGSPYGGGYGRGGWDTPQMKGDLFGAALARKNDADVIAFGSSVRYVKPLNRRDSLLTLTEQISSVGVGHSTNFAGVFMKAADTAQYDRIVFFSDMQANVGGSPSTGPRGQYAKRAGVNPYIYAFDLSGYGTSQFRDKFYQLAGFSEKVFDLMKYAEQDPNVLVNTIERVEL